MFKQKRKFLRVVDANGNRACEGLRVVEDFARFVWADACLSNHCKQLRHELAECLQHDVLSGTIAMRESQADVGRTIATDSEYDRSDTKRILKANFSRVQQAVRSLEEFAKSFDTGIAKRFEQIRYAAYQLEATFFAFETGQDRLANAQVYVLADATESDDEFRRRLAEILQTDASGNALVDIVQLRDKDVSTQVLIERCQAFHRLAVDSDVLLIVNDRPDVAAIVNADGVHLGQDDMTVHEARSIVGPEMLIGVSTHDVSQVESAIQSGANYIGIGPTFPSKTKTFAAFTGLDLLRSVAGFTTLPAFAIGGIDEDNVDSVMESGVRRIAVSAAVWNAAEPGRAAGRLRAKLSTPFQIVGESK